MHTAQYTYATEKKLEARVNPPEYMQEFFNCFKMMLTSNGLDMLLIFCRDKNSKELALCCGAFRYSEHKIYF